MTTPASKTRRKKLAAEPAAPAAIVVPPQPQSSAEEQAFRWCLAGNSEGDIREALAAQFPGIDPATVFAGVLKRLKAAAEIDPVRVRGWTVEALREIYRRSLEANDLPTALRAVKQLKELADETVDNPPPEPRHAEPEGEPFFEPWEPNA